MPECFYRASSVFCDTGYNRKTLDSRLKIAGMTACEVFDLCQYNFETLNMSFKDILGHDREIAILKKALSNDKVAHAFLFVGPEGCGKRLTALSLAKSLNCSTLKDDFCGECPNCSDIENLSYTDVFVVEPREPEYKGGGVDHVSGTIKIDAVRDVQQRLAYRAVRGGKKICIVDGIDKMNRDAQNAFLKTLEEPPSDSVIILIASDNGAILQTIVSRCQRIFFGSLPQSIIVEILRQRLGVSEDTAKLIAAFSGGSVGRALSFDIEYFIEQRKKMVEILSQLSIRDAERIFNAAEEIAKGDAPVESLEFLKMWYRDIAVLKEGREDIVINSDLLPALRHHAQAQNFNKLMSGFKMIHQAQVDIMPPRYANKQLTIENLLLQLTV